MKTFLHRALLALVALAAFALIAPGQAVAVPWCDICDDTNDCFACCRCAGGTPGQCFFACDYFFAPTDESSLLEAANCQAPMMTVATSADEAQEPEVTEAEVTEGRALDRVSKS